MKWHFHCWHSISGTYRKIEKHGKFEKDIGKFYKKECCKCGKVAEFHLTEFG